MGRGITRGKTNSITLVQNNERNVVNEPLPEINPTNQDELLKVMAKIWTTLSLSQKEAQVQLAIRASLLNQAIDHLAEMQMAVLKTKPPKESENENETCP